MYYWLHPNGKMSSFMLFQFTTILINMAEIHGRDNRQRIVLLSKHKKNGYFGKKNPKQINLKTLQFLLHEKISINSGL